MARPPRGKRPTAAPRFFVQSEFAPDWEFCRQFLGNFGKLLSSRSYCWCQCAPSLLLQTVPPSVVSKKTAPSPAAPEFLSFVFGAASLTDPDVNSIRIALPAHCGLTFFHFLPPLRVRKRLPAS